MQKAKSLLKLLLSVILLLSLSGCSTLSEETANVKPTEITSQQKTETIQTEDKAQKSMESASSEVQTTKKPTEQKNEIELEESEQAFNSMEVHFLDVGQGDSTLVTCGEDAMLIDAADDSKGTAIQHYLQKQGVEKLKYLILTHPDSDHIGAAPVIITKFDIDNVFMSNFEKDNKTYRKLIQSLDDKRLKYSTPEVGSTYQLGSAEFTILAPSKVYSEPNNASIAVLLQNGDNKFLFTGDAEEEAESDILENGLSVDADVFQAGHHGSKTSNSEEFIKEVSPDYVVISCGEGNSYGHPNAATLNTLRGMGIEVFRTDEQGTIVAVSDGNNIKWNASPSESWIAGEPTKSSSKPNADSKIETETKSKKNESNSVKIQPTEEPCEDENNLTYVLNSKTKKFHYPSCSYLPTSNRVDSSKSREDIINNGYSPCKRCNP